MAVPQAADIDDLVELTLNELNVGEAVQFAQKLQDYEVSKRLFKKDKVKFRSGKEVQWSVMTSDGDAAEQIGLFDVDNVNSPNLADTITVPWRHTKTSWGYDIVAQMMNSRRAQIQDMVKMKASGAVLSLADKIERQFFGEPSGSSDTLSVFGLKYWVVANASAGFNGGNNSNFSAGPGGIDSAAVPRWKNYTDIYADVTRADLVRKLKKAIRQIDFKTPDGLKDFLDGRGQRYRIYLDETRLELLEELAENQNDKVGRDLAAMQGVTTIKGIALKWIPVLEDVTSPTAPIYLLDFNSFFPMGLEGNFMRTTGPERAPLQRNVRQVHKDLTWNLVCNDRRRQAVLATAA